MPTMPLSLCAEPGCGRVGDRLGRCADHVAGAGRLTLVVGSPCAGKNTAVAGMAQRGDLVVDLDALYTALGGRGTHDQPASLTPFALDARDAVLNRLRSGRHAVHDAFVILSAATPGERRRWSPDRVVMVWADRDVCHERAVAQRPASWHEFIDDWHDRYAPGGVDEVVRTDGRGR